LADAQILGETLLAQPLTGLIIPIKNGGAHLLCNNITQLFVRLCICKQGFGFSSYKIRYNIQNIMFLAAPSIGIQYFKVNKEAKTWKTP
jgi:hypothetical protein